MIWSMDRGWNKITLEWTFFQFEIEENVLWTHWNVLRSFSFLILTDDTWQSIADGLC